MLCPNLALKNRRRELGLTQENVAVHVGVSKGTVSKWEKGEIQNMRSDKIPLVAEILHMSIMDILKICQPESDNNTANETNNGSDSDTDANDNNDMVHNLSADSDSSDDGFLPDNNGDNSIYPYDSHFNNRNFSFRDENSDNRSSFSFRDEDSDNPSGFLFRDEADNKYIGFSFSDDRDSDEKKFLIMYLDEFRRPIYEEFEKEDYDFIVGTIEMLKRKSEQKK